VQEIAHGRRGQPDGRLPLLQADDGEHPGRPRRGAPALQRPRSEEAGIASEDRVFIHASAAAHDHWFAASRQDLHCSPAIAACARASLTHTGIGVDEVAHLDLYSCFPSAVQIAAGELGIDLAIDARAPTVTGGLTFAGGPGSNYVTHSLAAMSERLREDPDAFGFLTGVGWYMTKHANAVISMRPPARPYAHTAPQAEVGALPRCEIVAAAEIEGPIESFTVTYERDGTPLRLIASCLRSDGSRALASSAEATTIESLLEGKAAADEFSGPSPKELFHRLAK
jgi:acetyl-CoA C-acetyltransferase